MLRRHFGRISAPVAILLAATTFVSVHGEKYHPLTVSEMQQSRGRVLGHNKIFPDCNELAGFLCLAQNDPCNKCGATNLPLKYEDVGAGVGKFDGGAEMKGDCSTIFNGSCKLIGGVFTCDVTVAGGGNTFNKCSTPVGKPSPEPDPIEP